MEWALGDDQKRQSIETAHTDAVREALAYITETVSTVRRRYDGVVVEECARDLLAAEYRHTTARSVVVGEMPDPQLHSHVVITSAVREDGRFVAVACHGRSSAPPGTPAPTTARHWRNSSWSAASRSSRAPARRAVLRDRRPPRALLEAFSSRTLEVAQVAEHFRARFGRAPEPGELRQLKRENRRAKVLVHRGDLDRAWQETAAPFQADREPARLKRVMGLSLHSRIVSRIA